MEPLIVVTAKVSGPRLKEKPDARGTTRDSSLYRRQTLNSTLKLQTVLLGEACSE